MSEFEEQLLQELRDQASLADERGREAIQLLIDLKNAAEKPSLTYRGNKCRHVLAEVYDTPQGILMHQPTYRLSEDLNASTSTADGRAKNTMDGKNQWHAQVYFLEYGYPNLQCDHVLDYRLDPNVVKMHVAQGKREVTI